MATNWLPTLYEYYMSSPISSGLSADQPYFTLNNKNATLLSGAIHYFRIPPEYWRDRLRKARAAGLNTVETYIPWNLHEPQPGTFDFGHGGSDFEKFLDVRKFLELARKEDLLAIVRPGPYICAEWEFGGLPSWLLRDGATKLRTSDEVFVGHVRRFYTALLSILSTLQFTLGGPIIAFQIENEYGNTDDKVHPVDTKYLEILKGIMKENGIVELLFTSDTPSAGFSGTLPDVLHTANFQNNSQKELSLLKDYQPGRPLMVMEYWTGWFDHWTETHHTRRMDDFSHGLETILSFPASVNMYMFHGGTNWGFMNGANLLNRAVDNDGFQPDTSSYDYDAPLTEAGDYTDKYFRVKELTSVYEVVKTKRPKIPNLTKRIAYEKIPVIGQLNFSELVDKVNIQVNAAKLKPMELLHINNNSGQSYGYIVYRKTNLHIPAGAVLKIEGRVCDSVLVLVDGHLKSKILRDYSDLDGFGYWKLKDSELKLGDEEHRGATLDLVVENWGRVNYGMLNQFQQYKGLWQGNVTLNDEPVFDWTIVPLEFKKEWINGLNVWHEPNFEQGPTLYKAVLQVTDLRDTYIDFREWTKGIVIVNGFVLSRYLRLGPQQAAYLPAPFLQKGENEILIFEHFSASDSIKFSTDQIYETAF